MTEKVEFASPEWLETLRAMMQRYTDMVGPDLTLSICEVFTGVPAKLDKNGTGVIAWHCFIKDGKVSFHDGEIPTADLKTVADYAFILPFAKMKIEPETAADYSRQQEDGAKAGKLVSSGDRTKVPQAFYGMHNELADMTA